MPYYIFISPTGEVKEIFQHMNDNHIYSENGVIWERSFSIPQTSIDTQINPHSHRDFIDKTKKKNYSIGDMWSESASLSEKRAKVSGLDEVKQKTIENYEKATGKKHPLTKSKNNIFDLMKDMTKKK